MLRVNKNVETKNPCELSSLEPEVNVFCLFPNLMETIKYSYKKYSAPVDNMLVFPACLNSDHEQEKTIKTIYCLFLF